MDAVITYVDNLDPQWQAEYARYAGEEQLSKRFRDWGTLKYLMRGIDVYLPFVHNVYLVVSSDSQVPAWVKRTSVRVILHKDIIPEEFLPLFNSCSIEMFLHRIPGLAEEYLYFNDDMFPVAPCAKEDFFVDGKTAINFAKHVLPFGMYKSQCETASAMARKALGMDYSPVFVRPQHTCSPMLKSACEEVYGILEKEILASVTRLRVKKQPNQYLFLDYLYWSGRTVKGHISNKHLSQAVYSGEQIADYIKNPQTRLACINDVQMPDEKFAKMRAEILAGFEAAFPDKSPFEK
ncbi:MAG: hypothetical protein J5771_03660 [Bacteroidales bacterium]|nr:hypothetical protein [Bacteroidales bacterium]